MGSLEDGKVLSSLTRTAGIEDGLTRNDLYLLSRLYKQGHIKPTEGLVKVIEQYNVFEAADRIKRQARHDAGLRL